MNFRDIVKDIDSLPALSDTTLLVRKLFQSGAENVNIAKLTSVIESDALLTANILKMINSPLYGFTKQITSVSQAVTLFGTEMVYGLVVKFSIESVLVANLRCYGISNAKFNDVCQMQSALMQEWYSQIDKKNARFLSSLCLIMESGKLVVAQEVVNEGNIKELLSGLESAPNLIEYENETFGTSSYYISGLLFEHWHFDTIYVDMLKGLDFEHDVSSKFGYYIDSLDVVRTAVNVKDIFTEESIDNAADIVAEMGLNVDTFLDAVESVSSSYEKIKS